MEKDAQTNPVAIKSDSLGSLIDNVLDVIDKTRSLGTENVVRLIRGIVYGMVAFVFLVTTVIFFVIILVRIADAYLPIGSGVGDASWAAHLLVGSLLSILGFGFWGSRKQGDMNRVWIAIVIDVVIVTVLVTYAVIG